MCVSLLAAAAAAAAPRAEADRIQPRALQPPSAGSALRGAAAANMTTLLGLSDVAATPLPPAYFISLESEAEFRGARMLHALDGVRTADGHEKLTRVTAWTEEHARACVEAGNCKLEEPAIVTNGEELSDDVATNHMEKKFTYGEIACSLSHLRAIATAWADGVQTALIVEDDISFEYLPAWPLSLQQLALRAPANWEILQLYTSNWKLYEERAALPDALRWEPSQLFVPWGVGDESRIDDDGALHADTTQRRVALGGWSSANHTLGDSEKYRPWSTMAYMINRAGMEKVLRRAGYVPASLLDAPGFSPDQMRTRKEWRGDDGVFTRAVPQPGGRGGQKAVTIPLPIVADGWLYQSASTYWVSYPMFGWLSFSASAIQRGKLGLDSTDARSAEQAEKFYQGLRGGASKPPADPLSIAVVATVFAADQPRHLANVEAIVGASAPSSTPSAGGQVLLAAKRKRDGARRKVRWTYAVNAMDNDLGVWSRAAFTSKGIFLMAQASGRRNNTFESRLISQLPLVDALLYSVATDYVWLIDGDISFKPTDIPGLEALLAAKGDDRVLAAQPAIDAAPDKPKTSSGGDQFFKPLNGAVAKEVRARCGLHLLPTPLVEIQAPLLASSFLAWHMPELRFVAAMQAKEQSAWGPDMLWCGAATRYATIATPPPGCSAAPLPCAVLPVSVLHDDTDSIVHQANVTNELRLQRGQRVRDTLKHSRDYVAIDHVNEWWDGVASDCERLKRRDAFGAYREFSMARGDVV